MNYEIMAKQFMEYDDKKRKKVFSALLKNILVMVMARLF